MSLSYKDNIQNNSESSFNQMNYDDLNDSDAKSLKTQEIIHEFHELCVEITSAYYENNFDAIVNKLFIILSKLKIYITFIQYQHEESSILRVFRKFEFENLIINVCESIIHGNQNEDLIKILISVIYYLTDLDNSFFQNHNLIPFLTTIFFNFENLSDYRPKIIETLTQILSNQIIFDPNYNFFSPRFFELLPLIKDNSIKAKLIDSFINSSPDMKIYYQALFPFLSFFFEQKRSSLTEIKIITKLIEDDDNIFPVLLNDGYINHILSSLSECREEINIKIIYFFLFTCEFDPSIKDQYNYDQICIEYLNSESEEEQICALKYFSRFTPDCLPFLYDTIGVDLLWAIISDGFTIDSTIGLKLISAQFLLKLLQFNKNIEMMEIILNSDVCEFCEIILNLDEIEPTLTCIEILFILLNIATEDQNYAPIFFDKFKSSNIELILSECSDEKVQTLASDFMAKFNELYQNPSFS